MKKGKLLSAAIAAMLTIGGNWGEAASFKLPKVIHWTVSS